MSTLSAQVTGGRVPLPYVHEHGNSCQSDTDSNGSGRLRGGRPCVGQLTEWPWPAPGPNPLLVGVVVLSIEEDDLAPGELEAEGHVDEALQALKDTGSRAWGHEQEHEAAAASPQQFPTER